MFIKHRNVRKIVSNKFFLINKHGQNLRVFSLNFYSTITYKKNINFLYFKLGCFTFNHLRLKSSMYLIMKFESIFLELFLYNNIRFFYDY